MKNGISIAFVACLVVAFACSVVAEDAKTPVAVEITGQNVNLAKTLCGEEGQELDETLSTIWRAKSCPICRVLQPPN